MDGGGCRSFDAEFVRASSSSLNSRRFAAMHEQSLVLHLLRRVSDLTEGRGPGRVSQIDVEVGEFAGVEVELFCSAFARETAGPPWSGPILRIRQVLLRAHCATCGSVELPGARFVCPACGSTDLEIQGGDDVRLLSFIWQTPPEEPS
ncbi:MAG: hydrogenase maturation nickel metallochaperone HypA [Planctomycetaceae bacterium]